MTAKIVSALASSVLLVLQAGFAGQAHQRADSVKRIAGQLALATISITDPTDSQLSGRPGTAVAVRAIASGATELDWLELWANDRRVGVQPAPKGGLKILAGVFAWTPEAAGTYSLVARATDREDRTVTSTAVDVVVAAADAPRVGPDKERSKPPTTLGNGVGSERTTAAAAVRIAQADARTETAGAAVPAERWKPGTPARRSGPRAQRRPDPPVLKASAASCQVSLWMYEGTGRADGYAVYRQSRSGLGWTRVAVLHAAAGRPLTFTDGGSPGRLHYYVTAFNERGETESNPVALDMDSKGCTRTTVEGGATPILKHAGPPVQELDDKRMPKVDARITYSVEQCKKHLPGEGANALEAILFCTPFPEYNSDGKQAYLIWSTDDTKCAYGDASSQVGCKNLDYYLSRAETYGGHVGYRLSYWYNDGPANGVQGYPDILTTSHDRTSYVVPPLEPYDPQAEQANLCGVEVRYIVELVYDAGPNDPEFAHVLLVNPLKGGADWRFICPLKPPDPETGEVRLDVRIGTLHLASVDDGDPGDDIEVYGFFRVWTAKTDLALPGFALQGFKQVGFRGLGTWGKPPGNCPTEQFGQLNPAGADVGYCHRRLFNGDHAVSQFPLCDTCTSPSGMHGHSSGFWSKDNNTIRIAVRDGEAVYIETVLMDYDNASADDPQCVGVVNTERHLLETWVKADVPLTMTQPYNGNSSCTLAFRITAVK